MEALLRTVGFSTAFGLTCVLACMHARGPSCDSCMIAARGRGSKQASSQSVSVCLVRHTLHAKHQHDRAEPQAPRA